uniref:Ig-like domain-containing protein n=1 Tax=Gopherus agassizii TaxID=38772 RepID=A0A452J225_9SAUR
MNVPRWLKCTTVSSESVLTCSLAMPLALLLAPGSPKHLMKKFGEKHQSPSEKTAMEGMSTTITCSYDRRKYMFNRKYWCRGGSRSSCDVLGDTENFVKSEYKGRVLLLDNRRGYFLVTMHQLVEEDSGMYWCGIQRPYADMMTAVKLTVTEGKDSLNIIRSHEIPRMLLSCNRQEGKRMKCRMPSGYTLASIQAIVYFYYRW